MRITGIIIALFIFFSFGCKKFVTIAPPIDTIPADGVFKDNTTATAAQLSIYIQMGSGSFPYNLLLLTGYSGDELFSYSKDLVLAGYYTNKISPIDERASDLWSPSYSYIYQANAIIEGLKGNGVVNSNIARQLTGESEFVRAFFNFYLTGLYGDIPLVTSTKYSINATISRTPQADVYKQIINDLLDAETKLSPHFVDASDTTETTERTRPTSWAAAALLARVYLYTSNYNEAYAQANKVISNTELFNLNSSLGQVFTSNNSEAIWQLQPVAADVFDTQEGYNFILASTPGTGVNNCSTISQQLMTAFETDDARKTAWIDSVSVDANVYYYPAKYKIRTPDNSEYSTQLRLAEQYLIRAEAQANGAGSGISGAISDLNVIRNRAGLNSYSGTTDRASVLAAIIHERQVEFFVEDGLRWLDLKRTGLANSVLGSPGNVTMSKGGSWSAGSLLYPIPQTERNNDPNLSQNPGY